MYKLLIFIIPLILFGCTQEKTEKPDELLFHYMVNNYRGQRFSSDTVTIEKIIRHDNRDKLLDQFAFRINDKKHRIRLFSNICHAPIDGGELLFELDTLGVIYSCSDYWTSSMRLKSNNDSLNDLIDIVLEHCLIRATHLMVSKDQEESIQFSSQVK